MTSKKILVLAYAISPTRGSEYSVAWNYVVNMSKDNELIVFYGMSGNHMGDIDDLEQYIEVNPLPNVRFISIRPNKTANYLNFLNRKGILVYSFYLAYNIWHRQVYKKAIELISKEHFDLIHYLGPIGYREPGYLWKINLPYIWGPIGGTTNVSIKLVKALPLSGKLKLGFRAMINYLQLRINPRLKEALLCVDVLLTATTQDKYSFKKLFAKESHYLPENGIVGKINSLDINKYSQIKTNLIWIGRIDENKALIILLESLRRIKSLSKIHLHIIGDGKLKNSLMKFSNKNALSNNITWHGAVKREKVFELLSQSHLHIITSVTEANTTVIFEAMSAGVPTISLDHCGMHDTICEKCGVKIPIHNYVQVINNLASQLDRLILRPDEIKKLSYGVVECAKKYTWVHRRNFFNNLYELAIENWNNKNLRNNDKTDQ